MSLNTAQADGGLIRLHFAPGTRAVRVRWVLEEIGVPYDLNVVNLWRGAHKKKRLFENSPVGQGAGA